MSVLISPANPLPVAPAVGWAEVEIAPAESLGRGPVLALLRPLAEFGLWVSVSDEAEFGLLAAGPVRAVMAAMAELQPLGEAVAVAPFVFDEAGVARRC